MDLGESLVLHVEGLFDWLQMPGPVWEAAP